MADPIEIPASVALRLSAYALMGRAEVQSSIAYPQTRARAKTLRDPAQAGVVRGQANEMWAAARDLLDMANADGTGGRTVDAAVVGYLTAWLAGHSGSIGELCEELEARHGRVVLRPDDGRRGYVYVCRVAVLAFVAPEG